MRYNHALLIPCQDSDAACNAIASSRLSMLHSIHDSLRRTTERLKGDESTFTSTKVPHVDRRGDVKAAGSHWRAVRIV
jgi:hypothetical protein